MGDRYRLVGESFGTVLTRLDNSYHALWIDRNMWRPNSVLGSHDEVRLQGGFISLDLSCAVCWGPLTFLRGGKSVIVMSCSPSKLGAAVLISMMIWFHTVNDSPRQSSCRRGPYLIRHLYDLWTSANTRARDDATILRDGTGLHNRHVQPVVALMLRVKPVHQVDREHTQMLVKELDIAVVDASSNFFADLVRRAALDHIKPSPAILCLGSRRGATTASDAVSLHKP